MNKRFLIFLACIFAAVICTFTPCIPERSTDEKVEYHDDFWKYMQEKTFSLKDLVMPWEDEIKIKIFKSDSKPRKVIVSIIRFYYSGFNVKKTCEAMEEPIDMDYNEPDEPKLVAKSFACFTQSLKKTYIKYQFFENLDNFASKKSFISGKTPLEAYGLMTAIQKLKFYQGVLKLLLRLNAVNMVCPTFDAQNLLIAGEKVNDLRLKRPWLFRSVDNLEVAAGACLLTWISYPKFQPKTFKPLSLYYKEDNLDVSQVNVLQFIGLIIELELGKGASDQLYASESAEDFENFAIEKIEELCENNKGFSLEQEATISLQQLLTDIVKRGMTTTNFTPKELIPMLADIEKNLDKLENPVKTKRKKPIVEEEPESQNFLGNMFSSLTSGITSCFSRKDYSASKSSRKFEYI